jgi:hypothetical protein
MAFFGLQFLLSPGLNMLDMSWPSRPYRKLVCGTPR